MKPQKHILEHKLEQRQPSTSDAQATAISGAESRQRAHGQNSELINVLLRYGCGGEHHLLDMPHVSSGASHMAWGSTKERSKEVDSIALS